MLFVVELQLDAATQSSYSSSGTTISLVVGVFVNALVLSSVGTALAFLKSNVCKAKQPLNALVSIFAMFSEKTSCGNAVHC